MTRPNARLILLPALAGALALSACADGSSSQRTSPGASAPASVAPRSVEPGAPDARGVLIYRDYAAVVARDGDTVQSMASRVGVSPSELAAYNGLPTSYVPTRGDELVLPPRPGGYATGGSSASAAPATVAPTAPSPLSEPPAMTSAPAGQVETVSGAGWSAERISQALDQPPAATPASVSPRPAPIDSNEVAYHEVQADETVYSIARTYGVLPQTLIAWNALSGPSYTVSRGQVLVIPGGGTRVALEGSKPNPPGSAGVATPPPSSARPLPPDSVAPAPLPSPNLSQYQTEDVTEEASVEALPAEPSALPSTPPPASEPAAGKLLRPVSGAVVSAFNRGGSGARNDGVDFAADPGEQVRAAASGEVALVSRSLGEWGNIVLVRHDDGLMTVYGRMGDITVEKGQTVRAGEAIGDVAEADTGRTTLHFEVRRGAFSEDPATFF